MKHITIFLDIDGVLATQKQFFMSRKHHNKQFNCYPFDKGCIEVFNSICDIIKPNIVLSTDWRLEYSLDDMNKIFKWNNITHPIIDFTPDLWKKDFHDLSQLEECRANEISKYIEEKQIGDNFLVIDDLDMSPYFDELNFIHTPRVTEGIKQTGILTKIVMNYKQLQK